MERGRKGGFGGPPEGSLRPQAIAALLRFGTEYFGS